MNHPKNPTLFSGLAAVAAVLLLAAIALLLWRSGQGNDAAHLDALAVAASPTPAGAAAFSDGAADAAAAPEQPEADEAPKSDEDDGATDGDAGEPGEADDAEPDSRADL